MLIHRLYFLSVSCFIVFGLAALYLNRKPYCIDSKSVEKIDIYTVGETRKSIYRCAADIATAPSDFILKHLPELQKRVTSVEYFLQTMGFRIPKMQISIVKNKPHFFVLENSHLWIGEQLVFAQGHLERAMFKNWIRSQWREHFVHEELTEDVMADLLYVAAFGDLNLQDPVTQRHVRYEPTQWPQVLQSVQGYCASPWRASEHYEFCIGIKPSQSVMSSQVLERSLRPLLTESVVQAYYSLKTYDRFEFLKNLSGIFQERHTADLPVFKNLLFSFNNEQNQMKTIMALREASEYVKNMNLFFSSSEMTQKSGAYRQFISSLGHEILRHDFTETFSEMNFDLIFLSETKITADSAVLAQFQNIQSKYPRLRIALKDHDQIWVLPSRYSLPLKSLGHIRADRAIVEQCTSISFQNILNYAEDFQRVLIVGTCQTSELRNYAGFVREGATGFARMNPKISFVQVHLPSALLRKEELSSVQNIFELLKKRESSDPVFQSLGWQELKWNESLKAYSPKAYIDAIELFRDTHFEPEASKQN